MGCTVSNAQTFYNTPVVNEYFEMLQNKKTSRWNAY